MGFTFRPAVRENVHLLLGLIGGTGSGKTLSALRIAAGLAGKKRFAVIDTEAGRAQHYADSFAFDHGDLRPPFRPEAYMDAIEAAEKAGYPVIVVDSMSHEHAGEGGLLDWHDEILDRMAGDDWRKREACNMRAWIDPKMSHKRMVSRLLQLRAHLILCFRAEPKVKMEKDDKGKTQIIDAGWQPICAKNLEFELIASFLVSHERPGYPSNPLKLPAALRSCFPSDKPMDEAAGAAIAKWAVGTAPRQNTHAEPAHDEHTGEVAPTLADVLTAITSARSKTELDAIQPHAAKLTGEDKAKAREAYKAKAATFGKRNGNGKAHAEPPPDDAPPPSEHDYGPPAYDQEEGQR